MMTGFGMGVPAWGGATNPQAQYQMWAAQQAAAQAYQNAMISFSQAGGSAAPSEIGGGADTRQSVWGGGMPPMASPGMMPFMGYPPPMMNPMGMGSSQPLTAPQFNLQPQDTGNNLSTRQHQYSPNNGSPLAPPRHLDEARTSANQSPANSSPRHGPVS